MQSHHTDFQPSVTDSDLKIALGFSEFEARRLDAA
jgi:hypothetical protein